MTAKDIFMATFAAERDRGLTDMKFFVLDGDAMSAEDFCAASNRIDSAIAEGRCARHVVLEDEVAPEPFAPLIG
jgi:hypothetical protein